MLIRRPVSEVFEAFVNPAITTKFWFTRSTGRLEAGRRVRWEWEMYGYSADVTVLYLEREKKIRLEWSYADAQTPVEFVFAPVGKDATYVTITSSGFKGDADKVVFDALRTVGGFAFVLAGLKAYLEHGIELNLIGDAFPKELRDP